jgi:hypothetical protein
MSARLRREPALYTNPKGREMIRNLKALGVAMVGVLAFAAMAASPAAAQEQGTLTSTAGKITLTGVNKTGVGADNNRLSAFGFFTECPNVKYTGHKALTLSETELGKKHELIPTPATQVTITPHYGVCSSAGFSTTVDMNGCDYTFDLGKTTGGVAKTYGVTATVHCPVGKHIEITQYTSSSHTTANHFCTVQITEKTTYTGLHVTDLGGNSLRVTGTIEGIEAHKFTNNWDFSPIFCSTQTTTTAKLEIDAIVTADDEVGNPTNVSISES